VSIVDLKAARWRKSSFSSGSGDDNCVEVAHAGWATAVRDSKNAAGPVLVLPATAWSAFLTTARR
jgi:uncharacterized protein DUF397